MLHSYRLLLLGCLALGLVSGCGSSSYSSGLGTTAVATGATTSGTASPSTPGFNGPSIIPGTHDLVVATASATMVSVVIGARQTVSVTFTSSDGLPMSGFSISGAAGGLPPGWSGPAGFTCAVVTTGSGCVLNLQYAPAAVDSGALTLGYTSINNAGESKTGTVNIAYRATTNSSGVNISGIVSTPDQFGAKCDGSTDDTTALTNWAKSAQPYTALAVKAGVVCIFNPGLGTHGMNFTNLSHFVIYGNGATIRAKAASATSGSSFMMYFKNSSNIDIYGLIIDGNLANRTGTASFGGDNIFIDVLTNDIQFHNVSSINAPKDNWVLNPDSDQGRQADYPTNISLIDSYGTGAYRNNLSAIGSVGLTIRGGAYNSASGASPDAGIDIEPDSTTTYGNTYTLIDGVTTSFNAGPGISTGHCDGSVYNSHITIRNWTAQGNGTYQFYATSVNDLEIDGAYISNVSATPTSSQGLITLGADASMTALSLRNLNFDNITSAAGNLVYTHGSITDRVLIDGVHAETISVSVLAINSVATVMNVDIKNLTANTAAIQVGGNSNQVLRNVQMDTLAGYALYTSVPNVEIDDWTVKNPASTRQVFYIDTGATGFVARNISVWRQSSSIPSDQHVWRFVTPPKIVQNFVLFP
jgi:hypothetical protein